MKLDKTIFVKALCLALIVCSLIFSFTGCDVFFERDPLDVETFLEVMEENGFRVIDHTNIHLWEGNTDILKRLIAVHPNNAFEIQFVIYNNTAAAISSFNGTRQHVENMRGNVTSHSSVSGRNHSRFNQTSAGVYSQLLSVDNIFVFVFGADAEYRDEIRNLFNLIS